jgi:alpha-L-rhamnosidase
LEEISASKMVLFSDKNYVRAGLAYRMAAQETFPSWGWWIINGATTFYENWPLEAANDISMNQMNHRKV